MNVLLSLSCHLATLCEVKQSCLQFGLQMKSASSNLDLFCKDVFYCPALV